MTYKPTFKRFVALFLFIGLSILSLFVGVNSVSVCELFHSDSLGWVILRTTRLPRTISIILSGATLSLSGLLMQQLTQNKFTSPATVGTNASARLGLILALMLYPKTSLLNRAVFAFIFAVTGTLVFIALMDRVRIKNSIVVPILGLMLGNVVSSFGTYIAFELDIVQDISSWLQGNFSLLDSTNYQLIFFSLISFFFIVIFAHYFSIMALGQDLVTELGISYQTFRLIGIVLIALGSASVLLTVGNISFVGIVIPNLVSLRYGDHFKKNIFSVCVFGMIFLLCADILARVLIFPFEIPVSVIVGILGSVCFIFLIFRGERV